LQRGKRKGHLGCESAGRYPEHGFKLRKHLEPLEENPDIIIGDDIIERVFSETKLGGVPAWVQNDETPPCPKCGRRMEFVAQIDSGIHWPEEGKNVYAEAIGLMMSKRVTELLEGGTKHVIVRVDQAGHELHVVEPDSEHSAGGVTIAVNEKGFEAERTDYIFRLGDAGVAYVFICDCGSDTGAFLWQCT
jgi:hypothetical protein